jgi:poly(3-hydroxybutyrate) depolymerase
MRIGLRLVVVAAVLAAVGCGGGTKYPDKPVTVGPIGTDSDAVWVFRPAGKPKDLVVFFHGQGGPDETRPINHLPWIRHLVSKGSIVVYPRFETFYEQNPIPYIVTGVRAAAKQVDVDGLPVLAIGYSRGGALAVEYGAVAGKNKLPAPGEIMSVFPASVGNEGNIVDLKTIDRSTQIVIQMGQADAVVGRTGARHLLRRLEQGGFPARNIRLDFVSSQPGFVADHGAPLRTSAAAKAAFWGAADELLDELNQK